MSDLRTDIAAIVKKMDVFKCDTFEHVYYYPDIPEKVIKKVKKGISADIGIGTIAVVYDTTLLNSGTMGMVFTIHGMYYKDLFVKKIFFNYNDVQSIYYGGTYINVKVNGNTYDISDVSVFRDNFISLIMNLKNYVCEQEVESKQDSGVLKKRKMPKELYNKCNIIIHGAATACGAVGAGLAQLPCADTVPITATQVAMIIALGQVFGLNIADGTARGIISGMAGSFIGRGIVQVAFGWIPGAGNVINTATATGLTESIGWVAADQFYNQSLNNEIQYSYNGEIKGYKDASLHYEKKLRDQAKHFLDQKKVLEEEMDELNCIINEYQIYISEHLTDKSVTTSLMQAEINELKRIQNAS